MRILVYALILICSLSSAWAGEKKWDEVVAAAKAEGTVVVHGNPDPHVRKNVPAKFTARYGIPVEYVGGRTRSAAAKIAHQRRVGVYSFDVFISSISSMANVIHPRGWLDPIKPILQLPEVVDPSKWKQNGIWYVDPEGVYLPRMLNSVRDLFFVHTGRANPDEIKSIRDLLKPKWKGKIAIDDPVVYASGLSKAAYFYQFGEEFVKRLYIDQKPVFSRERRQLTDWLAHGAYPIVFGARESVAKDLVKEGIPLVIIRSLADAPAGVSAGFGTVGLMKNAPHPYAARVFINWLLSREGLETYSRAYLRATTRNDVDESFLDPESVPTPGVKYYESSSWEYLTVGREKIRGRMKKMLGR